MRLIHRRLSVLEEKQPKNHTCYPIGWFYGKQSEPPEPLIPGLSLADFYNQFNKEIT